MKSQTFCETFLHVGTKTSNSCYLNCCEVIDILLAMKFKTFRGLCRYKSGYFYDIFSYIDRDLYTRLTLMWTYVMLTEMVLF